MINRVLRRWIWWCLVVVVLSFLGMAFLRMDEPPPDDHDLLYRRVDSGAGANGALYLSTVFDRIDLDRIEAWAERNNLFGDVVWTTEVAQETIAKTDPFYRLLQECLTAERFTAPEGSYHSDSFDWLRTRDLLDYVALRAKALFFSDREKDALITAIDLLRLGQRLEDSGGSLAVYLRGKSLKDAIYDQLVEMVKQTTLPLSALREISDVLTRLVSSVEGFKNSLRVEYEMQRELFKRLEDGALTPHQLWDYEFARLQQEGRRRSVSFLSGFQANRTRRLLSEIWRFMIKNCAVHRSLWDYESAPEAIRSQGVVPMWRNEIGSAWVNNVYSFAMHALDELYDEQAKMGTLVVLTCLKLYSIDNDSFPTTLTDLIPEYLQSLPADPFDGENLRYSPNTREIRSLGGYSLKVD